MIGALILGLVAGFLARALLPGKQDLNFILTILLGLAGAALGYAFFTLLLGIGDEDAFDLGGLPGALVGALVLLFIYDRVVASRGEKQEAPQAVTSGERSAEPGRGAGRRAPAESTGVSPEDRAERRERRERERRERQQGGPHS
jgi:uncharacterized membrane protein YeaQ/YmgE (transglycosylase-associated protein family)